MGEEFYISDIEKEISKIDGVINIISLRVYNEHSVAEGYSSEQINQETIPVDNNNVPEEDKYLGPPENDADMIDLDATDGVIYTDGDSMLEIKYPEKDIRVRIKEK